MSHEARVIRTGVSSEGPAAPPPVTVASSSAGSDVELMDGGYFRSCAGMLKVAQMVRGERGGGRCRGSRWGPRSPRESPDGSCGGASGERRRAVLGRGSVPAWPLSSRSSQQDEKPTFLWQNEALPSVGSCLCPFLMQRRALLTRQTDVYEPKAAVLTFCH